MTKYDLPEAFNQYLRDNYNELEGNMLLDRHCQSGEYPQEFLDQLTNEDDD